MMKQADTRRSYREAYWRKNRQITVTVPNAEYRAMKARAEPNGRTVGQQLVAESRAYLKGEYLPSQIIEERLREIALLIRNIANNINQMAAHSNRFKRLLSEREVFQALQRLEKDVYALVARAWRKPPEEF